SPYRRDLSAHALSDPGFAFLARPDVIRVLCPDFHRISAVSIGFLRYPLLSGPHPERRLGLLLLILPVVVKVLCR
ncbi:MAG: hypothetical protein V2G44_06545, partial [bacterium JZ-2024 1]